MGRMTRMGDLLGPEPVLLPRDPEAEDLLRRLEAAAPDDPLSNPGTRAMSPST